jgi:Flp pilus assembly protein TadG
MALVSGIRKEVLQRRAAAAVELALVVPLLAAIVIGMFEFSRGMMAKGTLCNAARKGCRTGILRQYGNTAIFNDAVNIMRDNGYDASKFNPPPPSGSGTGTPIGSVTITVIDPSGNTLDDALDAPPGSKVTVQVSIPVSSVTWATTWFLSGNIIESDLMVMMKQ